MKRGGGCFWRSHHLAAGCRAAKARNEVSRKTQNTFRFENSGSNSFDTTDPYKITLSRFGHAVSRRSRTKLSSLSSGSISVLLLPTAARSPPPRPRNHHLPSPLSRNHPAGRCLKFPTKAPTTKQRAVE